MKFEALQNLPLPLTIQVVNITAVVKRRSVVKNEQYARTLLPFSIPGTWYVLQCIQYGGAPFFLPRSCFAADFRLVLPWSAEDTFFVVCVEPVFSPLSCV